MADAANSGYDIAIVGMAGRFPGARNLTEFWRNLRSGVESVKFFTDEELLAAGESREVFSDPSYVKAQPVLADFDQFDAGLFGFSPQDAAIMDPQHRVFLEIGWEALENAGYNSDTFSGSVGVFATCGMNTYMMYHLITNRRIMDTVGEWLVRHTGNDMNFLATRLSYALNLSGPSLNVQTACSSALVAVHLACQSLLSGECDMALAGGATIVLPHNRGYLHKQGEILSPDGHCRAFDAKARGTLFGSGAGMVVLRRLSDAEADGDQILAVIKGSAVNNDGSSKVGYLAPSVEGQAKAVAEALTISGVDPQTISYVECHGTGTIVGDPIEITALTQAWRSFTDKSGICAIGSLKSNIGHLGEAAGVAALIKTVLALQNREIPPSLHYETPNPQIDFANSPFFVNAKLASWSGSAGSRRAGITSLGAGGTNCHVIVEEAPPAPRSGAARSQHLLLLSARSQDALSATANDLAGHLRSYPELDLADVAFTLQSGRKPLAQRRAVVCRDRDEAVAALSAPNDAAPAKHEPADRPVVFLFPGQGAQYPNMGRELYESEPAFRTEMDACAAILKQKRGLDILPFILTNDASEQAQQRLNQTAIAQPSLFVIEYALAKMWMSWGVSPRAMIGHSIGEYAAACLAGVFSLEDALSLVADRGSLMQSAAPGSMLAVPLPPNEIEQALQRSSAGPQLSLAAVNAPALSVVAGPHEPVAAFEAELSERGVQTQRLHTSHAFHSVMMEPVLDAFRSRVRKVALRPPGMPYLSNLTGTWIRPEEATDPEYWVRHVRNAVRFSEGLATLLKDVDGVLLEVGPGRVLSSLARMQPAKPAASLLSLARFDEKTSDLSVALKSYGQLWTLGCKLDPRQFYAGQSRRRVALPAYPFEHKRYWVEAGSALRYGGEEPAFGGSAADVPPVSALRKKTDMADWFVRPAWIKAAPASAGTATEGMDRNWLIFMDDAGVGAELAERLSAHREPETETAPLHLEVIDPGDLDSLALTPFDRPEPGAREVEIRVAAAALNFADVLKATGVFPEAPFGMECAGVIERVGSGVTEFRPGDQVLAIGPESFRSYVIRDARMVALRPESLVAEEAVTLPAAFMTAWHALHDIGKLRAGEKVLIHAASGGVGLAAIQVAQLLGAEIVATAGSAEKRAFLKSIGIQNVFDSRTLDFADEVLRCTGGKGVDAALNSLTGEFIPKTFATLGAGGRFLEIGKKEIYSDAQVAALEPRSGASYHPIDLTRMLHGDPDAYGALLHTIVDHARAGRFKALRRTTFHVDEAASAFQLMEQTRHIGKVVLLFDRAPPKVFRVFPGRKYRRLREREYSVHPGRVEDYAALIEALDSDGARIGHIAHLWGLEPQPAGAAPLERAVERSFLSLTWLGKALAAREWPQQIELSAVSTGLHQIAGETHLEPLKATLLGPVRVLPRELPNVPSRSIDVPASRAGTWQRERVVAQLVSELQSPVGERTVAYRGPDRWVQRFEPSRVVAADKKPALRQGGVYLISGGLGGIGFELAEHLARTVKARLVLVGRTALPPRERWSATIGKHGDHGPARSKIRRLLACEALGAEIMIASADIADRRQVGAVVAQARKRFGEINGVIHVAGTLDDGLIQLKTPQSALGVLAPKIGGAIALDEVLGDAPLDFFAMFSSVSAILGLQGQVDYTAANAFLDAFADYRSARRAGQTVAIDWSAWREIGMAARASGTERLVANDTAPRHPWLERRYDRGNDVVFVTTFDRSRQWVLGEHVMRGGDALIPGTGYMELARAAFGEIEVAPDVEISRVFFETPFMVRSGETKDLEIALRRDGARWEFQIQSEGGEKTHVIGHIQAASSPLAAALDIQAVSRRCGAHEEKFDGQLNQSFMDFGPRWGNVRWIRYGRDEALISLALPPVFLSDLDCFALHPAMLDMATGGAQRLIPGADKDFYIPFSYGRLVVHKSFTEKAYSHVRRRAGDADGVATFDVTICDDRGAPIAEIADFTMKRVDDRRALGGEQKQTPAAMLPPAAAMARQVLLEGILPQEGLAAFERILSAGVTPRVAVSPLDLHLLMRRLDADSAPTAGQGARHGAGAAGSGGTVERRLADMYAQILGAGSVGLRDDFFELGGHSLLAVRLLNRIEKEFGVTVPLPILFERPSVEGLAGYLHEFLHDEENATQEQPMAIVPFNENGTGPAFYCVHSVGGDVMGFRHLARLLGPDQRFYGIQAPPELRNAAFASSVEDMAKYYVAALLAFQPEGPYVLGGWSAGSIVALEMAHQLRAKGHEVPLVVALDGAPFNTGAGTSIWNPQYYWKLLRNLPLWVADDLLVDFSASAFLRRVQKKLIALGKKGVSAVRGAGDMQRHVVEGFLDTSYHSEAQVSFMKEFFHVLTTYRTASYPGRVLLFAAETQPLYHLLEVELHWAKVASDLEVVPVRGTHESIIREPYLLPLAAHLRARLDELRAETAHREAVSQPEAPAKSPVAVG